MKFFRGGGIRNEIIWHYRTYQGKVTEYFPKKHDVIFWYAKDEECFRDSNRFKLLYQNNYRDTVDFKRWKKFYVNGNQIKFSNYPISDSRFKPYLKRWIKLNGREPEYDDVIFKCNGYVVDDTWTDIQAIDPKDTKERVGYPTQKPLALLKRIIKAGSNRGDVVLDPFCGCATACVAAEDKKRNWIGIDISAKAMELVKHRFEDELGFFNPKIIHRTDIPIRSDGVKRSKDIKHTLFGKQEGKCKGCRKYFEFIHLEVDHKTPKSAGGQDDDSNLQLLFGHCNKTKGSKPMGVLKATLTSKGIIT